MREMQIIDERKNDEINDENNKGSEEIIKEIENYDKLSVSLQNEIIMKDSIYYKEKLKKNKNLILIFIGFILTYLFHFLSLESCYEGELRCSLHISWIKFKVFEELISCILLSIIIQLIIFQVVPKIHLIHIIIIFSWSYYYRHGIDYTDHGYFNFFFYFIMIVICNFVVIPLDILLFCSKHRDNKKKIVLIYLGSLFLFIIIIYIYLFNFKANCSEWPKGLNNTSIEYNSTKYGCQIKIPKKCTYKIFDFIQDYTKLKVLDCKQINNKKYKEIFLSHSRSPYVNKSSKRIGIPLTNKDPSCLNYLKRGSPMSDYIFNNLIDMDNKEILDKYYKDKIPEIILDYTDNDKGKLDIDVKFNKTLSEERKKLEINSKPYSDNILLLYIDSVSRANALRKLKKTMSFFEKFMPYKGNFNEKFPSEIFHGFQFFKYHSFHDYTTGNFPLLFYGQKSENYKKIAITKFIKENGYITCLIHDYCELENIDTNHNFTKDEAFDHQFIVCDPNHSDSSLYEIRCLYDKQDFEYFLEYIEQFWRKYKDNRKYVSLIVNHGHEGTLNVIKYLDEIIANFLQRLFDDNLLKDSIIIFISDHGVGMPSIYESYDFYKTEIRLPALFMIVNDRKNISYEKQYKYIQENQQSFITAFDIYNTLGNIIYGDEYENIPNKTIEVDTFKSKRGISLFNKINSKIRFPKNYSDYYGMSKSVCI